MRGVLKNNFSKNIVKDYCERVYFLVNLLIQNKQAKLSPNLEKNFRWLLLKIVLNLQKVASEINPSRNVAVMKVAWKT